MALTFPLSQNPTVPSDAEVGDNRLRPLVGVYDIPPLGAPLRRLIEWTANYYLAPPAAVLRMALASAHRGLVAVAGRRRRGH